MSTLRDRCGDLIATIRKLENAIEVENEILSTIEAGEMSTLDVTNKRQLASMYGEQMKSVQERVKMGEAIDRVTSDLLSEAHASLTAMMTTNRTLLRRAQTATSRMVSLIVDTARQSMPKEAPKNYGAPTMHQPKIGQANQSLALNVTL